MGVESITKAVNITKVGNIINNQPGAVRFLLEQSGF